jgi:hypothetical protein
MTVAYSRSHTSMRTAWKRAQACMPAQKIMVKITGKNSKRVGSWPHL